MQRQPAFYGPIFALFGQILCFTRNYSTWYMLHLVFSTGLFNKKFTDLQEVRRAAYLTCPPFSSHRLCTLDTSVILHTGITKKASKSLPAVKQTNANSSFWDIQFVKIFWGFSPHHWLKQHEGWSMLLCQSFLQISLCILHDENTNLLSIKYLDIPLLLYQIT